MLIKIDILLQERDYELFNYLFESRGATLKQIIPIIFSKIEYRSNYPLRRMKKLEKFGYITSIKNNSKSGQWIYYLRRKTFLKYIAAKEYLKKIRLKSDCEMHDLSLNNVRARLAKSKLVAKYYTENMLKSGLDTCDYTALNSAINDISPDAMIQLKDGTKQAFVFIELELNLTKGERRYRELLSKYYKTPEVGYVLYVCKDDRVKKKIMQFERQLLDNRKSKIGYIKFDDLISAPDYIIFEKVDNGQIIIK